MIAPTINIEWSTISKNKYRNAVSMCWPCLFTWDTRLTKNEVNRILWHPKRLPHETQLNFFSTVHWFPACCFQFVMFITTEWKKKRKTNHRKWKPLCERKPKSQRQKLTEWRPTVSFSFWTKDCLSVWTCKLWDCRHLETKWETFLCLFMLSKFKETWPWTHPPWDPGALYFRFSSACSSSGVWLLQISNYYQFSDFVIM